MNRPRATWWVIEIPRLGRVGPHLMPESASTTRSECITEFCGPFESWATFRALGYRAVRVAVTVLLKHARPRPRRRKT